MQPKHDDHGTICQKAAEAGSDMDNNDVNPKEHDTESLVLGLCVD